MFRIALSLILSLSVFASGCGIKFNKKKSKRHQPTKYFVHGDPEELIAGTVRETSGLIATADALNLSEFTLLGAAEFRRATDKADVDQIDSKEELEEKNNTEDEGDGEEEYVSRYSFVANGGGKYDFRDKGSKEYPTFNFKDVNGKLLLESVDGESVKVLHHSLKSDGEAMSLLFDYNDESGRVLVAFYFLKIKDEKKGFRFVNAPENYFVRGDGIAIPWKRDFEVNVCGKNAATYFNMVQTAMDNWATKGGYAKGKLGQLNYKVSLKADARPFSDLNQNCVNFIDSYRNEDQENLLNMGITLTLIDDYTYEIFNAPVFIFLKATDRSGHTRQSVLTHELGHALGLGHEFSENHFTSALPSIMGYDDVQSLTESDGRAIRLLYGE